MVETNELGYFEGALRAVKQAFNFAGRSGHTELLGYYFFSMVAGLVLSLTCSFFVTAEAGNQIDLALQCPIFLPFFQHMLVTFIRLIVRKSLYV